MRVNKTNMLNINSQKWKGKIMIKFKNTEHAMQYGQSIKNDQQAIKELKYHRQWLLNRVQRLKDSGQLQKALYLASGQAQFSREALEQAI